MTSQTAGPWAVEIEGLTKRFGSKVALQGLNLRVEEGEFLTIFGPNGAGKTTLIRILATLSKPTAGSVRLAGLDLPDKAVQIRRRIGVVSHQTFLYDDLTAEENLRFYGRMYDVPHLEERIQTVIRRVDLEHRLYDRVRTLSRGMQQRLSIARALIHDPLILLLDEPHTGLDQHAAETLGETLRHLAGQERTIVMTTHDLERGLQLAHRVAILVKGHIVYDRPGQAWEVDDFRRTYYEQVGTRSRP